MLKHFSTCMLLSIFVFFNVTTHAQQKKNLSPDDYGKWQSIGTTDLSPNGEWVACQITVQEDNDTLYLLNRTTHTTYKLEFASAPEFSKDNQWVAYRVGVSFKEAEKLKEQTKPIEYKMGLLNLTTGKKEMIQNISRFGFSRNGKFLAAYLTPPKENKDKGAVLLIKNLSDGTTRTIGNVTDYAFNKKSDHLAYIVESANAAGNSTELFNLENYTLKVLTSDTCKFSKLSWQKEGEALAFFKSYKKEKYEEENAVLYTYTNLYKAPVLKTFDPETAKDFPAGMRISNTSDITISDDMSSVFFGLNKWTFNAPAKKNLSAGADDKATGDSLNKKENTQTDSTKNNATAKKDATATKQAGVDIWHWKDPEIQPRQKITLGQDTMSSYLSVWNLDNNTVFQLAKEDASDAQLSGNQKAVVIFRANITVYKFVFYNYRLL